MMLLFLQSLTGSQRLFLVFSLMQIIAVKEIQSQFIIIFQIEQKTMSNRLFTYHEDNQSKSNLILSSQDKRQRLLKIEQKLEAITLHKHNQAKDQTEEDLTKRVLEIEQKCTEQIKNIQTRLRELRQTFSQMKLRETQLCKKCDLSKKSRLSEIKQLQKKLNTLVLFESKQRKDLENCLISILQKKDKQLVEELLHIKQARIEIFNRFQRGLEENLPQLSFQIEARLAGVQKKLECLHQEVRKQVECLQEKIEIQERERAKGIKNIVQLLYKVTEQIKIDLQVQRKTREHTKIKLLNLFENAYGRLQLL